MIILLAVLAAVPQQADADPLAPARAGMVQCYGVHPEQKTCNGISRYRFNDDGTITNESVNIARAEPLTLFHARSTVYVRDGAECTMITDPAALFTAVEVDGVPVDEEALDGFRAIMGDVVRTSVGVGEYCTRYRQNPDGTLQALTTVDGVEKPGTLNTVLWVSPDDGWRVGF